MPYGLYIHIPFCHRRCFYCDFYTEVAPTGVPEAYINALLRDFLRFAPKNEEGATQRPETVYFGGGTPGLLMRHQMERLLNAFLPKENAEITLEVNPESASLEKLAGFRAAGVNRLSVGVQSASDASLARLGRLHTAEQARAAFKNAHKAGFENISGDIMLALPKYGAEEFGDTLCLLREGGATHISSYLLKIEENTPFGKNLPAGLPDTEEACDFYLAAVQQLADAGYCQYEISNFALPGYESKHNMLYWDCRDYLGIGPSAHSCMGGQRSSFAQDTAGFLKNTLAPQPEGECTAEDYIMLRLRLHAGLLEADLLSRFGQALTNRQTATLGQMCNKGYAVNKERAWALTPAGMLVQNAILTQLLG